MNPTDTELDAQLRSLDAAGTDPGRPEHKQQLLRQLLDEPVPVQPPAQRPRVALRWLAPVAAAALLAGGFVWFGSPSANQTAWASWTAVPQQAPASEVQQATQTCREEMERSLASQGKDLPAEQRPTVDPAAMQVVAAERRGNYLAIAMADEAGSDQQCIFEVPHLERTMGATGGWASVDSPAPAPLGARGLEAHGGGGFVGSAGGYAMSVGRVGNRVTAVTVHTNGRAVTATVSNGHYVAWWPVEELTPSPDEHYDLTLADGTVLRDVTPRG